MFTEDELTGLLATCKGGRSQNRRDYSVISLFKDAGVRLSELAGFAVADVSPATQKRRAASFASAADRHDIGGARWGLDGAEAVLALRAVISNGDFEEYWRFHLAREHQRLYPGTKQGQYALGA